MTAPLPEHLRALVTQASAVEVPLCTVDEAQLLLIGWPLPYRGPDLVAFAGQANPYHFAGLDTAVRGLLDAGLAERGAPGTPVAMTSRGALRDYLQLVISHRLQTATWSSYAQTGVAATARSSRRLTALREAPVVVVERFEVPADATADEALPIAISLAPLDAVADELTTLAYRPPIDDAERAAAPGTESVFIGPDRKAENLPSVLVHRWDQRNALLHWRYLSLFGRREPGEWVGRAPVVRAWTEPHHYRQHLLTRLQAPEPPPPAAPGRSGRP